MTSYSPAVTEFWRTLFRREDGGEFALATNPELDDDRRVMILTTAEGRVDAVVTPAIVDRLDALPELTESTFRQALADAGVTLHGADHLFYFEEDALLPEVPGVRRLDEQDAAAFAQFRGAASEQDLDDAYVELDHWAVFGAFEQDRLVCAASAYPWGGAAIADLGVLTLPPFRGRGHARAVVRGISRYARAQGFEPQYRCQLDNHASVALAASSGLSRFGEWEVVSPDSAS